MPDVTCDHEWEEIEVFCELCCSHNALLCVNCHRITDLAVEDDPREPG